MLAQRTATLTTFARPAEIAVAADDGDGVVAVLDPNEPGHYPTCPFLRLTGLGVPGCGSLAASTPSPTATFSGP